MREGGMVEGGEVVRERGKGEGGELVRERGKGEGGSERGTMVPQLPGRVIKTEMVMKHGN